MTEYLLLGKSEEEFWESTPRKVLALIDQKNIIEKTKCKNLAIYTACYVWGKDPDENEVENNKIMPGRDIPISDGALKGLML
jgi:hypothetical protein